MHLDGGEERLCRQASVAGSAIGANIQKSDPKGAWTFAVDVWLSPLIPLAILFAHAIFLYAVFDLPLTCVVKMPFALGIILSFAVSFLRCSSRHPSRIRHFIITRAKSLLTIQQGAKALSGVAGIVEKAVPSSLEFFSSKVLRRTDSRPSCDCGRGALVGATQAYCVATLTLAAERGVLDSGRR